MQTNTMPTPSRAVNQIGFWSAILTTAWILIFNIALVLGVTGAPTRLIAVGASLLLALSFLILMSSIHNYAPQEKRVWSQIGLSFSVLYAALLVWNYFLQLTVVRANPQLYSWLSMEFTPDTAFWSLETIGYTLMSLSTLFALPVLSVGRIELAIRWCFAANAVFAVLGSAAYVLSVNPLHLLVMASLGVWAVAFPIGTALLAVMFKRAGKINR